MLMPPGMVARSTIKAFFCKHIPKAESIGILHGIPTSTEGDHVLWLDEKVGFTLNEGRLAILRSVLVVRYSPSKSITEGSQFFC
jgi:hypothetical protein